jgi:hypothetical protein
LSPEDNIPQVAEDFCGGAGLGCLAPTTVWQLFYVSDVDRGRFTTSAYDDAVMIGTSESDAKVRILFGGTHDHTTADNVLSRVERNRLHFDLIPNPLVGVQTPSEAKKTAIEDYNGDGVDDVAVLYGKPLGSEQIRIWFGANAPGKDAEIGVRGLGQAAEVILLNGDSNLACDNPVDMIAHDLDGDGGGDLLVMCRQENNYQVRWYRSNAF